MLRHREYMLSIQCPTARNADTVRRQQESADRTVRAFQRLLDELGPDRLQLIYPPLEAALADTVAPQAEPSLDPAFVRDITGERERQPHERAALELAALQRAFQWRRSLLADAPTAPEVARMLGT